MRNISTTSADMRTSVRSPHINSEHKRPLRSDCLLLCRVAEAMASIRAPVLDQGCALQADKARRIDGQSTLIGSVIAPARKYRTVVYNAAKRWRFIGVY